MLFFHISIVPIVFFIFTLFFHKWLDQKEFNQAIKIFFIGLLEGLTILIFNKISNFIFKYSANPLSIFIKCTILDGIIFSLITILFLYFSIVHILGIQITVTWSLTSVMIYSFLSGVYSLINFFEAVKGFYPNSVIYYLYLFSYLFLISIILGFGIPNFLDSLEWHDKILWLLFSFGLIFLLSTFFSFFKFYESKWLLLLPLAFIITFIFFDIYDFKYFRK